MAKNVFFSALGDPEGEKAKAEILLIKEDTVAAAPVAADAAAPTLELPQADLYRLPEAPEQVQPVQPGEPLPEAQKILQIPVGQA